MNDLIAAFERLLFGMDGMPFGIWDLAAWTFFGLAAIPVLFYGLRLFAALLVAVFTPMVAITSAKDRKRDADFFAANQDRVNRAMETFGHGKVSGDWTPFEEVTQQPYPVREPTPANEIVQMGCLPLAAMAAAVFLFAGLGFACVRWIQIVGAG